jgi:HAD superfamily hydrolase (TIGR01509 family)
MKPMRFQGLIFDMDGTLTVPMLDFKAIRREIGIQGGDLVVEIGKRPPGEQKLAWEVIEAHEERAAKAMQLQPGALDLLSACRSRAVKLGLVTRNAARSVEELCRRFSLRFDAVVTREFPHMKPHPGPVLHILDAWRVDPREVLTVGDYLYDLQSGRAAGTQTCFFHNPGTTSYAQDADFSVASMAELSRLVFDPAQ